MHSNYHRVNIDGDSYFKTETRVAATNLLPGTFAVIGQDNKFAQATAKVGRVYVIGCGEHEGLNIRDAIPAGHSAVGNYVEEGREMAILVAAGTYKKDQPIGVGSDGKGVAGDEASAIGYCQDDVTIDGKDGDFIRVRFRVGSGGGSAATPNP